MTTVGLHEARSRPAEHRVQDELAEFRRLAAQRSGGTSTGSIKGMVVRIVEENGIKGRVLDFGAGTGELINLLSRMNGIEMHGADIMPRPAGIPDAVIWSEADLNEELELRDEAFDAVICSEVIEHLENPRSVFRGIARLLRPGGKLVLTTPNQETLRSYLTLIFRGHFAYFTGANYPAHITALLRMDLVRICAETGFSEPRFVYSGYGWMPITRMSWQRFSFDRLRGRLFSDNLGLVVTRLPKPTQSRAPAAT
jgi:2-polyprenyl-3-methyl-5-hydroxy-6-metoxy-1,4-benzoquinol methylase